MLHECLIWNNKLNAKSSTLLHLILKNADHIYFKNILHTLAKVLKTFKKMFQKEKSIVNTKVFNFMSNTNQIQLLKKQGNNSCWGIIQVSWAYNSC